MEHPSAIDGWWRRHFEQRAQWTSDEAQVSAWSRPGLTARLAAFERLLPRLAAGPGVAVLDLGCGAGIYTGLLAARGYRVTAIDYAFPMVRRARACGHHARFVVADGRGLPFRPASFDLLLCIGVLQCCERPRALICEAARLLRPGGALLIESLNPLHFVVPFITLLEIARYRPRSPVVRHPARAVEGWLRSSGVEVRDRIAICVRPTGAMWAAGLLARACVGLPALWRLGATAIWWHGQKQSSRTPARDRQPGMPAAARLAGGRTPGG